MGITIGGWQGAGTDRHTKGPIGTIPITITTSKAGRCMRATGIMKITRIMPETRAMTIAAARTTEGTITEGTITTITRRAAC
jgi:hypothetical protein